MQDPLGSTLKPYPNHGTDSTYEKRPQRKRERERERERQDSTACQARDKGEATHVVSFILTPSPLDSKLRNEIQGQNKFSLLTKESLKFKGNFNNM
jgi:hypothetical protein